MGRASIFQAKKKEPLQYLQCDMLQALVNSAITNTFPQNYLFRFSETI